jgi:glycerol kinase
MSEFIAAIDQGTTGSTVVLVDKNLQLRGKANHEFPQHFPQPAWVEHKPAEIWRSIEEAFQEALSQAKASPSQIAAIGITNQRETTVLWDRASGEAVHNAIVWQDRRTTEFCQQLKAAGHEAEVKAKTGLVLDPYFSGTKLRWLLEEGGFRAQADKLAFGTIDSYLVYRLSGGAAHVTDASNASRTLLMNLETGAWDDALLELLSVPCSLLPEIRGNAEIYATTKGLSFLPDGIPIAGMAGDQQAALFGQACFQAGDAKCTYGTGAFLLVNTGDSYIQSKHGLLSTIAWQLGGKTTYALEGSSFIAGAAVQWLRDRLGMIRSAAEIEALAAEVAASGDVVFVPAFAGLGAPHWQPEARAALMGMSRDTGRAHIARACLEGIALQITDLLQAAEADRGKPLSVLKVDGGAAANTLLMQYQADMLQVDCVRPVSIETTAMGAAFLAGLGVGFFSSQEEITQAWREDCRFQPAMSQEERARHLHKWKSALAAVGQLRAER